MTIKYLWAPPGSGRMNIPNVHSPGSTRNIPKPFFEQKLFSDSKTQLKEMPR